MELHHANCGYTKHTG